MDRIVPAGIQNIKWVLTIVREGVVSCMPVYYDIHTHRQYAAEEVISIQSLYDNWQLAEDGRICSLGVHPWYLDNAEAGLEQVTYRARATNVVAIGECGLDKVCKSDWGLQVAVFRKQVELAIALRKPLVIHCVRAFNELMQVLDGYKMEVPVVVHGYNKKVELAAQLLDKGCFLSLGAALLRSGYIEEVAATLPMDRIFLETDGAAVDVRDIYRRLAEIRKTREDAIILQLQQNVKKVFGI